MPKTVLIVDDDALNIALFEELLTINGCRTIHVQDGAKVAAMVCQQKPDLILMDVRMPNTSGLEIARHLKNGQGTAPIPIILISGLAIPEAEIKASGCDGHLLKPIVVSDFLSVINAFLEPTAFS